MPLGNFQVVNEVCVHFFTTVVFTFKYVGIFFFNLVIVYSQVFLYLYFLFFDIFSLATSTVVGCNTSSVQSSSLGAAAVGSEYYSLIIYLLENTLRSIHLVRLPIRTPFKKNVRWAMMSRLSSGELVSKQAWAQHKNIFNNIYDNL